MPRYRRMQVLNKMEALGIIPVFYTEDVETGINIVKACVKGGALCLEMTNRGDGAIEVFKQLEAYCKKQCPEVMLGVGSIVDAGTAAMYINAGANFVVGPCIDTDTARACNKRKVPYSPGCGSLTEIHKAHELGVEICKIFPGGLVGGPSFVKAIKGPCPWVSIMPTGGVAPTEESLSAWFGAGITCAGMGSKLITKDLVKAGKFDTIAENVKNTLGLVRKIRMSL